MEPMPQQQRNAEYSRVFYGVPRSALDPATLVKLHKLEKYDLSAVIKDGPDCKLLEQEIKRFFALRLLNPGLGYFPIVPPAIDRIWHDMVLDTRLYREFCEQCAHSFIDHGPKEVRPMSTGERIVADWFFEQYETWFKESPSHIFGLRPFRHGGVDYGSECA